MTELLRKSQRWTEFQLLHRAKITNQLMHDRVTHGKIGLAPHKPGRNVYFDLNAISDPLGKGGRPVACFTNIGSIIKEGILAQMHADARRWRQAE